MKVPKLSFIISLLTHAAFICILLWAGGIFTLSKGGGTGGSKGAFVSVWVADASGRSYSGTTRKSTQKISSPTKPHSEKPSKADDKLQSAKSIGDGLGAGGGKGPGIGGSSGEGAGSGKDGEKVLAKIWKQIDRRKYYPMIAKRQKLEGRPKVTFELNEDGSVKWVRLAASCGSKILDDAAIETVHRASPLPYYPKPITLALKYSISD